MPHCSFLKAVRPEYLAAIPPFLFWGLCLWRLLSALPSFPVARFSWWLLPNYSLCSLLKAACPERFPDNVWAGPGMQLSPPFPRAVHWTFLLLFQMGADSSTMPSQSLPIPIWRPSYSFFDLQPVDLSEDLIKYLLALEMQLPSQVSVTYAIVAFRSRPTSVLEHLLF
jgi:hypothetical protein